MSAERQTWKRWAHSLHRWGVQEWIASLLEAAGPLTILGAQVLYVFQPWFERPKPASERQAGDLQILAGMLEDRRATQAFVQMLREVSQGGHFTDSR
jgi:hypothetical protein